MWVLKSTLVQKILVQPNLPISSPATTVKKLHDTTRESLLALHNLGINTISWSPFLPYLWLKNLDGITRFRYEQSLEIPKELQLIGYFLAFLETHFQSLKVLGQEEKQSNSKTNASVAIKQRNKIQCKCFGSGTHHCMLASISYSSHHKSAWTLW